MEKLLVIIIIIIMLIFYFYMVNSDNKDQDFIENFQKDSCGLFETSLNDAVHIDEMIDQKRNNEIPTISPNEQLLYENNRKAIPKIKKIKKNKMINLTKCDFDDKKMYLKSKSPNKEKYHIIYNQYHHQYRDVITAIQNIVPDQKKIFNEENYHVYYENVTVDEVKNMVHDFIILLNKNIITEVDNFQHDRSGWDEFNNVPSFSHHISVDSGWEKVNKDLGLEPSLYESPHQYKHVVELNNIIRVEKQKTDYETKYLILCILGKQNIKGDIIDKIILKLCFVLKPNCSKKDSLDTVLFIEEVSIYGYLTLNRDYQSLVSDDTYFPFEDMKKGEIKNDREIISQFIKERQKNR